MFREVEATCERGCFGRSGVSKILCVRQCISPSCYRDLYQGDLVSLFTAEEKYNIAVTLASCIL